MKMYGGGVKAVYITLKASDSVGYMAAGKNLPEALSACEAEKAALRWTKKAADSLDKTKTAYRI